jgi:hypothetical protein
MIAMRWGTLCLVLPVLGGTVFADTLLSVNAAAGSQTCSQASAASASCSVSSTVYVPAGQFSSPVSAGGSISFASTGSPEAIGLGPSAAGPLDYTLQGNWSMGQGIALSGQAAVSLSATIDLPSSSANWTFYGDSYDATDDQGGGLGPIEIVTSNGDGWIYNGTSFTIAHTPGTPFSVSVDVSDLVEESDSSNNLDFAVRMVDPIATPEPATWLLVACAVPIGFLVRTARKAS